MLWARLPLRARSTPLCDKVCQWLAAGQWFSPGPPVSSTNKTDRHDITEILLKVALNTIKPTNQSFLSDLLYIGSYPPRININRQKCIYLTYMYWARPGIPWSFTRYIHSQMIVKSNDFKVFGSR